MASVSDESDGTGRARSVSGALEDYIGFHLRLAQGASFRAFQRAAACRGCGRAGSPSCC